MECAYLFDDDGTQVRFPSVVHVTWSCDCYVMVHVTWSCDCHVMVPVTWSCVCHVIVHVTWSCDCHMTLPLVRQMYCCICSGGEEVFMCDAENCAK